MKSIEKMGLSVGIIGGIGLGLMLGLENKVVNRVSETSTKLSVSMLSLFIDNRHNKFFLKIFPNHYHIHQTNEI